MAFVYDKDNQCFSMEMNNILFSCETLDPLIEKRAEKLAHKYESMLPSIAEYIIGNEEFRDIYGELSRDEFLEMLQEMTMPWIFLKENAAETIAYCDPDYVIEFAFSGDFEAFSDLCIDS